MTSRVPLVSAIAANGAAGTLFAWSVLLPALSADLGLPADDLGVVFSAALVVFAAAMLAGGRYVDTYGPRRCAAVAGILSALGLVLAATATNLPMLILGIGVLFGSGSGLTYLSTVAWVSTRTAPVRAFEIGLVVAAYAAGPMVAAPFASLGTERFGWRATLAGGAVLVTAVILLAARGLPVGSPARDAAAEVRNPDPAGDGPVGDPVALVALWLLFFSAVAPGLLAFAFAAPASTERGVSSGAAGLVVSLMAVGNLVGRLLPTPLLGRFGLLPALWAGVATMVIALVPLAWSTSAAVAVVALPLLTLQYGMVSALLPAATRLVTRPARFGTAYGRVFSSFGVAGVLGPFAGAALHVEPDGYARGFQLSLLMACAAAVALTAYQRRLRSVEAVGRRR